MTKDEMMTKFYGHDEEQNYRDAQMRIMTAMKKGAKYVLLPGKNNSESEFKWHALPTTISRLREDGFDIDKVWDPWEYWSVEWGYNE